MTIRLKMCSVFVDDQANAQRFYTEVLGFVTKQDMVVDPESGARWLTVVSPMDPDGTELLLEPNGNPIATTYQSALREQGIPAAAFASDDVRAEHARLSGLGVTFTQEPTEIANTVITVFDDTCGNFIQLFQA